MIRCEYCDSQLDDNSKFCPNCGAKLTAKSKVGFNTNNNTNTTNSNINNTTTKSPAIKGFGLGFIITFFGTLIGVGFMGIIALVLVIAFGDDKAFLPCIVMVFPCLEPGIGLQDIVSQKILSVSVDHPSCHPMPFWPEIIDLSLEIDPPVFIPGSV